MSLKLIKDQTKMQIKGQTDRSRTLKDYSMKYFNFFIEKAREENNPDWTNKGIGKLLEGVIKEKGKAVWVDLGCGNGVAMRGAKMYLHDCGIDPNKLHAYGYDVLPIDEKVIAKHIADYPKEFSKRLLRKNYSPNFFQEDIANAKFPEKPDLVTAIESIFWTEDPLKVFANAASQAKVKSILMINRMGHMYYSEDKHSCGGQGIFKPAVMGTHSSGFTCVPGLKINKWDGGYWSFGDNYLIEKISEHPDFSYGLKLLSRRPWIVKDVPHLPPGEHHQGFWYVYGLKNKKQH